MEKPEFVQEEDFRAIIHRKTHIADTKTHIVETETHILSHIGVVYQARAVKRYVTDLVDKGKLLPLFFGKPSSPNQKYIRVIDGE